MKFVSRIPIHSRFKHWKHRHVLKNIYSNKHFAAAIVCVQLLGVLLQVVPRNVVERHNLRDHEVSRPVFLRAGQIFDVVSLSSSSNGKYVKFCAT